MGSWSGDGYAGDFNGVSHWDRLVYPDIDKLLAILQPNSTWLDTIYKQHLHALRRSFFGLWMVEKLINIILNTNYHYNLMVNKCSFEGEKSLKINDLLMPL